MIGLALLAAHMVGDYITQTQWMASNKLARSGVRCVHVTVYTLGFIPVMFVTELDLRRATMFLGLLWITHFITDSRRWASGAAWPPKPILVDQAIHVATLAILGIGFGLK